MNQSGGRYPPRTLYQIVCGLNRHLLDINAENSVNMLSKGDQLQLLNILYLFFYIIKTNN